MKMTVGQAFFKLCRSSMAHLMLKQIASNFLKHKLFSGCFAPLTDMVKNFSLFLEQENRYRLTPFYDVMSAYPLIKHNGLQKQKVKMAMAWQGENKHYLWDKIRLRHIFNTAKLAGLAKEVVEEILHEISVRYPKVSEINTHGLPEEIVEPILMGLESKMKKIS